MYANPKEREAMVAREMAGSLLAKCPIAEELVAQDVLAHHFGLACQKLSYIADEVAARRILHRVSRELGELRRAADKLNEHLLTSTEELLQAQREAKRAGRS